MGKRGPAPAPTPLKIIKGEKRSRINRNEPQPAPADRPPACPAWLSAEARKVWRRLAPDLYRRGVLTEWDSDAFAVYCEAVIHYRESAKLVDASAPLIRGAHGNLVKNPALQAVRDQATIVRAFAQEFGLTPSSRAGLTAPETADLAEARRLLS